MKRQRFCALPLLLLVSLSLASTMTLPFVHGSDTLMPIAATTRGWATLRINDDKCWGLASFDVTPGDVGRVELAMRLPRCGFNWVLDLPIAQIEMLGDPTKGVISMTAGSFGEKEWNAKVTIKYARTWRGTYTGLVRATVYFNQIAHPPGLIDYTVQYVGQLSTLTWVDAVPV